MIATTSMRNGQVSAFLVTMCRPNVTYPWAHSNFLRVARSAEINEDRSVCLANSPEDADVVLFVESSCPFQTDVIQSTIYRTYPGKSVVLCFLDCPHPIVPGFYVGADCRTANLEHTYGLHYPRVADNALLSSGYRASDSPRWLYSFKGRVENAPIVRGAIVRLSDERALLKDAHSGQSETDVDYPALLSESKFVLCPRGIGLSSWRLFETMRAGRVPVVIADGWLRPPGIDWDRFAVVVRESDIAQIPNLLRELEPEWAKRAALAKETWEQNFAPNRAFAWICQHAHRLINAGGGSIRRMGLRDQLAHAKTIRDRRSLLRSYVRQVRLPF